MTRYITARACSFRAPACRLSSRRRAAAAAVTTPRARPAGLARTNAGTGIWFDLILCARDAVNAVALYALTVERIDAFRHVARQDAYVCLSTLWYQASLADDIDIFHCDARVARATPPKYARGAYRIVLTATNNHIVRPSPPPPTTQPCRSLPVVQ